MQWPPNERTKSGRMLCFLSSPRSSSFNLNRNIRNGYFYNVCDGDCVFIALYSGKKIGRAIELSNCVEYEVDTGIWG